ncbi:MAG: Mov34/MPN/PAD-1 family protein [Promethearchaeota archaeon]
MKIEEDFVFPVYISEKVMSNIKKLCKNSKSEIFGYLVGEIFSWKEKLYVLIENHLFIKGAVHSDEYSTAQIEGTAGKYEKEFQKLKKKKNNDSLRIVGWWHSHPGFTCFLSATDVATQEFFFPESYQIALVIDPINDDFKFFTLDNDAEKGYKEINNAIVSNFSK